MNSGHAIRLLSSYYKAFLALVTGCRQEEYFNYCFSYFSMKLGDDTHQCCLRYISYHWNNST